MTINADFRKNFHAWLLSKTMNTKQVNKTDTKVKHKTIKKSRQKIQSGKEKKDEEINIRKKTRNKKGEDGGMWIV